MTWNVLMIRESDGRIDRVDGFTARASAERYAATARRYAGFRVEIEEIA
jgi:hypothetical protein